MKGLRLRFMTYNVGGGRRDAETDIEGVRRVVGEVAPDVLAVQEAVEYEDSEGRAHRPAAAIAGTGGLGEHYAFGETLSLQGHFHADNLNMHRAAREKWKDWKLGNALFSGIGFVAVDRPDRRGHPRNVPIYSPPVYGGNRDTEPRAALLARLDAPPSFPIVVTTHFSTLVGERARGAVAGVSSAAVALRRRQARALVELLSRMDDVPIIVLGDFNAEADEPCLAEVLGHDGGFVRLEPRSGSQTTHVGAGVVDHILFRPAHRLEEYESRVVGSLDDQSPSDHLPVVAEIVLS